MLGLILVLVNIKLFNAQDCIDISGWADLHNFTCLDYRDSNMCLNATPSTEGIGAVDACCECGGGEIPLSKTAESIYGVIIFLLLMMSGLFSGLNLGLMGLDPVSLEIIATSGSSTEHQYAKALCHLRKQGNFLLCTLLLGNTVVNAILAIIMASMIGGLWGGILTILFITVFGEIIPQSICSKHGLVIGYYSRPVVYLFMLILSFISWPIAKVLDLLMVREIGTVYNKQELKKLLQIHAKKRKTWW